MAFRTQRSPRFGVSLAPGIALALVVAFAPTSAQAQCPKGAAGCFDDEVMFLWSDALFTTIDLDSGWVPAGSPLQVRVGIHLAGTTEVELLGTAYAFWPPPISIDVEGLADGGRFLVDYGLEITARIRFDVTVAGIRYTWEGDIPIPGGIPRDLRVASEATFDSFLLPPAMPRPVTVSDATERINVVMAGLGSIIPVPGVDGGFVLAAEGRLTAGYRTDRILVSREEAPLLTTHLIEAEDQVVQLGGAGSTGWGASEDVAVLPTGTAEYAGSIALFPGFYIEVAGSRFDFPLATFDVPIVDTSATTDFDPEVVHVPLPDVRIDPVSVDFGRARVGERIEETVTVYNDGEAALVITPRPTAAPFDSTAIAVTLPPRASRPLAIGFTPDRTGTLTGAIVLDTNDPDRAIVTIRLVGEGMAPPDAGVGDGGRGDAGPGISTVGGCGCRVAGRAALDGVDARPGMLALLALLVVRVRRRRSGRAHMA